MCCPNISRTVTREYTIRSNSQGSTLQDQRRVPKILSSYLTYPNSSCNGSIVLQPNSGRCRPEGIGIDWKVTLPFFYDLKLSWLRRQQLKKAHSKSVTPEPMSHLNIIDTSAMSLQSVRGFSLEFALGESVQ